MDGMRKTGHLAASVSRPLDLEALEPRLLLGAGVSPLGGETWQLMGGELNVARHAFASEGAGGYAYAIGRVLSGSPHAASEVERYDPQTATWTMVSSMPTARHSLESGVLGD